MKLSNQFIIRRGMRLKLVLLIISLLVTALSSAEVPCSVIGLKCEYLENPIGIDAVHPRFTWKLKDARRGAKQVAYQVLVSTDSAGLLKGEGKMWETGKVLSEANLLSYQGKSLAPFTKYYWKVEVWDKDGIKSSPSPIASFETGMMEVKNWKGAWISDVQDIDLKQAGYFRKTFGADKKIRSARAYIAVGGLYELYINGSKISNHRLDPMYTRFDRRTLYVTHDVTSAMQSGKNAIGVLLGNGWYNHQSSAVWFFDKAPWRNRPAFCLDLRITYEDGSEETITSGTDWKTSLSPIIFNSIYTAEHYDARLEQAGWNTTNFDDSKWKEVGLRAAPSQNIVAQALHPIRAVEEIPVKNFKKFNDTTYIFDLGRNISGVSRIKVKGPEGTIIRLKHTERINEKGRADMSNIDQHYRPTDDKDPFQTDIFILCGRGEESFMPRFNYKGFQYIEVSSSHPVGLTKESITGYFMHSDVPVAGHIQSSNPIVDKIWQATNSSYLSNLFGYPTDCPQREKNGWTGDAHIAIETGLYGFDGITIYEKWLADHRDEQQPNGVLPAIIPTSGWGYKWANGPDWTSTIAIIPWNIYMFYGDNKILSDNYENIKRYINHIEEMSPQGLTSWGLGDWVPVKSKSPVEFTSSIYYYTDVSILARTANLLGKQADYDKYTALADKIKRAINAKYLNQETGVYGSGLQTELSAALHWGIVPEELKGKVAANLAKRVEADNFHLDVGLLGTKTILNALSENGYANIAYKVASQETFPSWGWWIKNGATTLYENWDIKSERDISLNHIMFGEIGAWYYKALGGIRLDSDSPGFKNISLQPCFVEGLNHYDVTHESPYGEISSSWKRSGNKVSYSVVIPPGSTATLRLPVGKGKKVYERGKLVKSIPGQIDISSTNGEEIYKIQSGSYQFEVR